MCCSLALSERPTRFPNSLCSRSRSVRVSTVMTQGRRSTWARVHAPSSSTPRLSVQKGQENVFIGRDNPALNMLQILILLSSKVPHLTVRETKARGAASPVLLACPSAPCMLPLPPEPPLPTPIPYLQPAVPTQDPCPLPAAPAPPMVVSAGSALRCGELH